MVDNQDICDYVSKHMNFKNYNILTYTKAEKVYRILKKLDNILVVNFSIVDTFSYMIFELILNEIPFVTLKNPAAEEYVDLNQIVFNDLSDLRRKIIYGLNKQKFKLELDGVYFDKFIDILHK